MQFISSTTSKNALDQIGILDVPVISSKTYKNAPSVQVGGSTTSKNAPVSKESKKSNVKGAIKDVKDDEYYI